MIEYSGLVMNLFFYNPLIGQHVSVVDVVVRICQEGIECFSMVFECKKGRFSKEYKA